MNERRVENPGFLTREEIDDMHLRSLEPGEEATLRNEHGLESATHQPQNIHHYGQGDLYETAAGYAFHIAESQAYVNGNKRTATLAATTFLQFNGVDTSKLPKQQTYEAMVAIAEKRMNRTELGNHFRDSLEPHQKQEQTREIAQPHLSRNHAREELTPARADQLKREAQRQADETIVQRLERERAERSQQPVNTQERSQSQERSSAKPETMVERLQREGSAQAQEKDQANKRGQEQDRQSPPDSIVERLKREQAARQQQDTGSRAAQVQEGQQRDREHDR